ncbi:hypothetical protein [Gelidibacter pelagius]|uniref:Uncharacterized protein n=1 Tax=Gelidibacter pelagius TaxID=2819985 RepID=A0ABS3SWC2_9FLAO|nr:hypothetical protein [Gelidibacter pelagius]MBO3100015.1 hypothetical protein [Gelidibacter pelagius]
MKKNNRLEIIATIVLFIGVISFLSQKFFYIDILKNAYGLGDFFLVVGSLLWSLNLWKKRKEEKENKQKN